MEKLTNEQSKLVEDNEKLIPWFCHKYHLNIEEWYGTLAIVLCQSAKEYDENKGAFSTYFAMRAFSKMSKEFHRSKAQRNYHKDEVLLDEVAQSHNDIIDVDMDITIADWIAKDDSGILKLKYDGYTQSEIAETIGKSQKYVSMKLKELRKDLENELYR